MITDEILVEKYGAELKTLKKTLLLSSSDQMSDIKFLDLLKAVLNNNKIDEQDSEEIGSALECSPNLVLRVHKSFYQPSSSINVLNFDFPKHILKKPKFGSDQETIKMIVEGVRSSYTNDKIVGELELTDLISQDSLHSMEEFLANYLFEGNIKNSFNQLINELKNRERYKIASVKIKECDKYLLSDAGKGLSLLLEFNEYYVRMIYPFVAIHDVKTLKEVATVKVEHLEIRYK